MTLFIACYLMQALGDHSVFAYFAVFCLWLLHLSAADK